MANTKSSKKDLRRSAKRRIRNQASRSALKTYVKRVRTTAATGDEKTTAPALIQAISALDKAAQQGIIHKNQAARRKSRVAKAANKAKTA
jgi:small subunit ribosomal protein S20